MKKPISIIILVLTFAFSGCESRIQPIQELKNITELSNSHLNACLIYKTYFKRAFIFSSSILKHSL